MLLQWSGRENKYLIEEKEDDLLPPLMPPPVVKFELWQKLCLSQKPCSDSCFCWSVFLSKIKQCCPPCLLILVVEPLKRHFHPSNIDIKVEGTEAEKATKAGIQAACLWEEHSPEKAWGRSGWRAGVRCSPQPCSGKWRYRVFFSLVPP